MLMPERVWGKTSFCPCYNPVRLGWCSPFCKWGGCSERVSKCQSHGLFYSLTPNPVPTPPHCLVPTSSLPHLWNCHSAPDLETVASFFRYKRGLRISKSRDMFLQACKFMTRTFQAAAFIREKSWKPARNIDSRIAQRWLKIVATAFSLACITCHFFLDFHYYLLFVSVYVCLIY